MSPVDRDGPVTGTNFAVGSYDKFQPGFRDEIRPKIPGLILVRNSRNKANVVKHKVITSFRVYQNFNWQLLWLYHGNLIGYVWCGKQDDVMPSGPPNSSHFNPGNRATWFPGFYPNHPHHNHYHNQLLSTKFGRILRYVKNDVIRAANFQIIGPLTEKTWGQGWIVLVVRIKWREHFTRLTRNK